LRARLKASAGHIWPAGRMLCMPGLRSRSSKKIANWKLRSSGNCHLLEIISKHNSKYEVKKNVKTHLSLSLLKIIRLHFNDLPTYLTNLDILTWYGNHNFTFLCLAFSSIDKTTLIYVDKQQTISTMNAVLMYLQTTSI